VKDEYAFDFLELGDQHSEYQLEQAILQNIRQFLVEMGGDFCFIGNQFPLELSGKDTGLTCCSTTGNCNPWWPLI
jgi:predicted nuclease of restriction endonuclease-like (RecB) superfamily